MSKASQITASLLTVLLGLHWYLAWFWVPVDVNQGESYRIIYLHVPAAFASFASAAVLLYASIRGLTSTGELALPLAKGASEVGLLFTVITLATGSIWGRPTWGTWWTWDARLTTTLLLALLYSGWLLLYSSLPRGPGRSRGCAILGIMIALDVPIIYKSVTWWRTLHQPQTILRPGGSSTMDPDMRSVLIFGVFLMLAIGFWLIYERKQNIQLHEELEQKSLAGV